VTSYDKEECARWGWQPELHQIIYRANILIAETQEKAQQALAQYPREAVFRLKDRVAATLLEVDQRNVAGEGRRPANVNRALLNCSRPAHARLDFLKRLGDGGFLAEQYIDGDGNIHICFPAGRRNWCANDVCRARNGICTSCYRGASSNIDETIMLIEIIIISQIGCP